MYHGEIEALYVYLPIANNPITICIFGMDCLLMVYSHNPRPIKFKGPIANNPITICIFGTNCLKASDMGFGGNEISLKINFSLCKKHITI